MADASRRIAGPWLWALPVLAAALMLLLWLLDANADVFLFFNGVVGYTGGGLWANVTTFGDSLVVFSMALFLVGRHPRVAWTLVLSAVLASLIVHGLKEGLNVDRPPAVFPHEQIHIIGSALEAVSFPSGHTTAAFVFAGIVATQLGFSPAWRLGLIALAVLIGISRMAVGVHWPMDILGGVLIGWTSVSLGAWLAPRIPWGLSLGAQRFFALLFVGAALTLLLFHDSGYGQARMLEVILGAGALLGAARSLRWLFSGEAQADFPSLAASDPEPPAAEGSRPGIAGIVLRLGITGLIFWLIFRSVDAGAVADAMGGISPRLLLFAIVFQMFSTALAAYRWNLVMRPLGYDHRFSFYLKSYFKGMFFNQALPTSIGGDAIRVLDVARGGHRKRDAFRGVFIDRLLGLVGLLILNLGANALAPDLLPRNVYIAINLLVGAGLAGFVVMLLMGRVTSLERWRTTRFVRRMSTDLALVLGHWKDCGAQLLLSVGVHLLSLFAVFLIGRSVGLEYDLVTFLIIVPPAILLTLIPVSLAGWGIREGALVGLFAMIGADEAVVLSMSILYGLVLIVASLPGLAAYLTGKYRL